MKKINPQRKWVLKQKMLIIIQNFEIEGWCCDFLFIFVAQ